MYLHDTMNETTSSVAVPRPLRLLLIGYGKLGKAIEQVALHRGHEMIARIDQHNQHELTAHVFAQADVAIECTGPESAADNIRRCLDGGVPVVSGSTGWLDRWSEIVAHREAVSGGFLYASNFSVGVNLFFALNQHLAKLMARYSNYQPSLHEIHHTAKKDAPSGTAITLAQGLIAQMPDRLAGWTMLPHPAPDQLPVTCERTDPAPGTHIIRYASSVDEITITHTAHSREGFALGAVLAAEFMPGKQGLFSMQDVLQLPG